MAWFSYICKDHGKFRVSLEKREKTVSCSVCGSACLPIIKAGSFQILEKLDNGAMAKAVERLNNIEEIMEERADHHAEEAKKAIGTDEDE